MSQESKRRLISACLMGAISEFHDESSETLAMAISDFQSLAVRWLAIEIPKDKAEN